MEAGLVLVALLVSAVGAGRWGRTWVVPLVASSVVWLLVNDPVEGSVLVTFTAGHGLTSADLAGLAGLVLAALVLMAGGPDRRF